MTLRSSAALSAVVLVAASSSAAAVPNRVHELMEQARANAAAHPARVATSSAELPQVDPTGVIRHLGAYAFIGSQSDGDQLADDGNGYRFLLSTTSGGYLGAPVQIPAGAMIDSIGGSICSGTTGTMTVGLFDGEVFGAPVVLLGSFTTDPNNLCDVEESAVNQLYGQAYEHPLYVVIHWEGPMDGTLRFNDVFVRYHLTVSPAPGSATFNDVPTSHPFFQYVEALASSTITAGCGNGNFCPDQPVTRGQMAVFLAKALGLNWPPLL